MSTNMKWPDDFINKVICGDCLEVMKGMPDECVDLIVADPPYNIGKKYGHFNDRRSVKEYKDWLMKRIIESERCLKKEGMIFIFMSLINIRKWISWFPEKSRIFASVKNFSQYRNVTVQYAWTPIVYWEKEKSKIKPTTGKRDWCLEDTASAVSKPISHPAVRTINVLNYLIKHFSLGDDIIFDPFMGSGTTARAAKDFKRSFIGIEINPDYCKIAEERLAQGVL